MRPAGAVVILGRTSLHRAIPVSIALALTWVIAVSAAPPSPVDKIITRCNGKLVDSERTRAALRVMTGNVRLRRKNGERTSEPGYDEFAARLKVAHQNEIQTLNDLCRQRDVLRVWAVPSRSGSSSPDFDIEIRELDGNTRLLSVEVTSVTGFSKQYEQRAYSVAVADLPAGALEELLAQNSRNRVLTIRGTRTLLVAAQRAQSTRVEEIVRRLRAKIRSKQLAGHKLEDGREVSAGGVISLHVSSDGSPKLTRDIEQALEIVRNELRGSPIEKIEVVARDRSKLLLAVDSNTGGVQRQLISEVIGADVAQARSIVLALYPSSGLEAYYEKDGVREFAGRTSKAAATRQAAKQSSGTAVVTLAIEDQPAPTSSTGLGLAVSDVLAAADVDVDEAARRLLGEIDALQAINPEATVTLVGRGSTGRAVGRMMAMARERDAENGLRIAAIVTDTNLGTEYFTDLGYAGPVVVVPAGRDAPLATALALPSAAATAAGGQVHAMTAHLTTAETAALVERVSAAPDRAGQVVAAADGNAAAGMPRAAPAVLAPSDGRSAGAAIAAQSSGAPDLGGIDFSTLELRYLAEASSPARRAAAFAFKAVPGRSGARRASIARRAMRESSDAFFVWLALPRESLTVNLNRDEPNRIVDSQLGRTDAGRILLEADLRMKKTTARLIHPHSQLGARFWRAMDRIYESSSARLCLSFRQWIVPAAATVSESRGELYILKAPLYVKMESDYRQRGVAGGSTARGCPGLPVGLERRSEAIFRRLILPHVQRAVRRSPEYAALRRVYLSRVAAEWYRRLGAREGGAFVEIIDSGDISRWVSKRRWRPREVFDRYVRSFEQGEFRVRRRTRRGNVVMTSTLIYGGVDFTAVPRQTVSAGALRGVRPGLPARLTRALARPSVDRARSEVWLAGASFEGTSSGGSGQDGEGEPVRLWVVLVAVLLVSLLAFVALRARRRLV